MNRFHIILMIFLHLILGWLLTMALFVLGWEVWTIVRGVYGLFK